MDILSEVEAAQILVDWINAGSVVDPLDSSLRGTDKFAFLDLRKGSGQFPKVQVEMGDALDSDHMYGTPIEHTQDFTFVVWFYAKHSKENWYASPIGSLANERLVSYWLTGALKNSILGSSDIIQGLARPRFGTFSGVQKDPDYADLYRGFITINFMRRTDA